MKQIYIAADHGGFELKGQIIESLKEYKFIDLGAKELDPEDDYPVFAFKLAIAVVSNGGSDTGVFGVLICRSGIGMSIAANKVDGAYAALCVSPALAVKARQHNNANILVLDSDYTHDKELVLEMVQKFLETNFEGGRHERRVEQIKNYELNESGEWL